MHRFSRFTLTDHTGKELQCDCGFMARGEDAAALLTAARAHALETHGMDLPAPLVLGAAKDLEQAPDDARPTSEPLRLPVNRPPKGAGTC
jgi:hypothetical protein